MEYKIVTAEERPELEEKRYEIVSKAWPEFMTQDPILNEQWHLIDEAYPEYQLYLMDPNTDKMLALGNCMPLPTELITDPLPNQGIDWMFESLGETAKTSFANKDLFAIQIVINPELLGEGLSTEAIKAMVDIGKKHGCKNLFAPVRPNHKTRYPLIPMETYIKLKRDDGLLFDPWMRVHERLGAETMNVCQKSMTIPGTVAEWEEWTGCTFPVSGQHIIDGALVPITIDTEEDSGLYIEPNVWMKHRL